MRAAGIVQPRHLRPIRPIWARWFILGIRFYREAVKIKGERNRRGTIVYVCSSDGNDGGAVVEVPAWMFDSAVCCLLHPGTQPSVCVPALRALHALLNWTREPTEDVIEDVIEAHQST